jgi:hypothetical protein
MALIVQIRKYPFEKGSKSRSVIIDDDVLEPEKVALNVKKIYDELKTSPETTITFYR